MVIIPAFREIFGASGAAGGIIKVAASNKYWPGAVANIDQTGQPGVKVIILSATDATHIQVKLHPDEGVSSDNRSTRPSANLGPANLTGYTGGVSATATATLASAVATNAVTINGVTFTAVASGAAGNQWNIGGTDTLSAAALAAAINGSTSVGIAGVISATSALGVVTIASVATGEAGNAIAISKTGSPITLSPTAALAGGSGAAINVSSQQVFDLPMGGVIPKLPNFWPGT